MSKTINSYYFTGGGGGLDAGSALLSVTVPSGYTVTATKDGITVLPSLWLAGEDASTSVALIVFAQSQFDSTNPWTITATDGTGTTTDTILIATNREYELNLSDPLDALAADIAATGWGALSRTIGDRFVTNPEARTYTRTTADPVIGISSRASSQYWACGAVSLLSTLPGTYNQYGQMQSYSARTTPNGTTYYVFRQPNGFPVSSASLSLIFDNVTYTLQTSTTVPYVDNNGHIACDNSTTLTEMNSFIDRLAALV